MKILQVCAYAAPYEGNFINSLKALDKKLKDKGHETLYAFPVSAKEKEWCLELAKTNKVYFLPLAKARIKPSTYRALKRIYKENPEIEIVHSHFELYDIPVVLTAKKKKVFWHLHDPIYNYSDFHNRLMYKIQYKFLHKKATLLAVGEKVKDYAESLGFPKTQSKYVPNGLNVDNIKKVETIYADRKYDFLFYGWDYKRKGVDLCAKAISEIKEEFKVALIGKDDTEKILKEEFGETPKIEIVEAVKDVNVLYQNSKNFLHISRAEGLSYALLEAIYSGLRVVCSDIRENLFASEFPTVLMVKSEDVESIRKGMEKAISIGAPSEEDILKAREIIDEKYSIESWTKQMISIYGV